MDEKKELKDKLYKFSQESDEITELLKSVFFVGDVPKFIVEPLEISLELSELYRVLSNNQNHEMIEDSKFKLPNGMIYGHKNETSFGNNILDSNNEPISPKFTKVVQIPGSDNMLVKDYDNYNLFVVVDSSMEDIILQLKQRIGNIPKEIELIEKEAYIGK